MLVRALEVQNVASIYIIQFVCLFVRESRLNYAKNSHQNLRNYRDPLGRMIPRIGVTRPVVTPRNVLRKGSWNRSCLFVSV